MESRLRLLTIACAVVFLAGVVATFTVDGDDGELASADSPTTTAGDDVDTDGSTTTAKPKAGSGADDSSTTTTTEAGSSTTTEAPASSTTTTVATTTTAATTTIPERTPTTPGTYTYEVTGTSSEGAVDGESVLTVSEVDGNGRQTHHQKGDDGESTTTYRYTGQGTFLESMEMVQRGQRMSLVAQQPFLLIPADAGPGTSTSGVLVGEGQGNDLRADVTFSIVSVESDVSKVTMHADFSGSVTQLTVRCDIDGTMDSTIDARTSDQLQLRNNTKTDMTVSGASCPERFGGQQIKGRSTSDITAILQQ